jgi:hypothetical protein
MTGSVTQTSDSRWIKAMQDVSACLVRTDGTTIPIRDNGFVATYDAAEAVTRVEGRVLLADLRIVSAIESEPLTLRITIDGVNFGDERHHVREFRVTGYTLDDGADPISLVIRGEATARQTVEAPTA